MDISVEEALKSFTIKQLQKMAEQYQIQLKSGKKQDIIHTLLLSSISKDEWKIILSTNLKPKLAKIPTQSSKSTQSVPTFSSKSIRSTNNVEPQLSSLEQRVGKLEIQVQQILSHLSLSLSSQPQLKELSIASFPSFPSAQLISRAKFEISSHVSPGESMTIDEILSFPSCQSLPRAVFDQIIIELIDDAIFDGAEANSHAKIQGMIGRIIRRR